jgi:hypothetical protein
VRNPSDPDFHYALYVALGSLGRASEASFELQQAQRLKLAAAPAN